MTQGDSLLVFTRKLYWYWYKNRGTFLTGLPRYEIITTVNRVHAIMSSLRSLCVFDPQASNTIPGIYEFTGSTDSTVQYTVCVCVFFPSSSLDVPAGVTQEEGHTGFLIHLPSAVRALIFVARRIQPFLSLVDREVEFCVLTN